MNKKLNKKWLFSLFSVPLVALPIGLSTMNNSTNSVSLVSKSLNINESTEDENIDLTNALPVANETIKSFGDYIVSYEDNNISPVNVVVPGQTADSKTGGATVGMTADKQTITLTTYAGLLLWSHKLVDNQLLKQYYSSVKSTSDISTYKVINFAYLENMNILFVLFGNENKTDLTVFGLDISSGSIVVPSKGKLADNQVIAKVRDNSAFIFFNSSNQLLITSGDQSTDIVNSSKIMSFEKEAGFANVKGNDDETNNFGNISGAASNTDYLLGFLPSSVKGVNYSIWLYVTNKSAIANTETLSYVTGKNSPEKELSSNNKYFNYYVLPVSDTFTKLGNFYVINRNSPNITNISDSTTIKRGYLNDGTLPDFDNISKRFFNTESSTSDTTTSESIGILIDSDDAMFSSFVNYSVDIVTTDSTSTITPKSCNMYMNFDGTTVGPKSSDLTSLADDVSVSNYEFNSVGYDKESNFVYFSLSGEEETGEGDAATTNGKYLTNTRYVDLDSANIDKAVSADKYVEDNPYTLSDVNFDTYSDQNNLYLTKQTIDGNDGQWLSTSVADFNDDDKDFTATNESKINFSRLDTLASELESSKVLDNVMPSAMKENLSSLDSFLNDKNLTDTVKFTSASGDDATGEISFETEITYENNFGDGIQNGLVSYIGYIDAIGFSTTDFSLSFKETTDSAITDVQGKYSAQSIIDSGNKGWVIQNLIKNLSLKGEDFSFSNWPVPESAVTLSNGEDTNQLKVEINVPVKKTANDKDGILPVGFPAQNAIITQTYNFTGTDTPPLVNYPYNPLPSNPENGDSNNGNNSNGGLSGGAIAGIVIGCLALAAIIIAVIVLVRIRSKSKIAA